MPGIPSLPTLSLRPSMGFAVVLSTGSIGCFCTLRRGAGTAACLQSLCSLAGVVFYGAIVSVLLVDASAIFLKKPEEKAVVLPKKPFQPAKSKGKANYHDDSSNNACGCNAETFCPICLVDFEKGEAISYGEQCGHCFHEACIQQWITRKPPGKHVGCPFCRRDLLSKEPQLPDTHNEGYRNTIATLLGSLSF